MKDQKYIDAFNSFSEMVAEGIEINHSGFTGTAFTVEEYDDVKCGAGEHFSNHLDYLGLESKVSIEDCLNGDFPDIEVSVCFSIEIASSNDSFQDDNAIEELKRILKNTLKKLDECDPNDEYFDDCIFDLNGNKVGDVSLTIEEA